jgi:hypothetical protein
MIFDGLFVMMFEGPGNALSSVARRRPCRWPHPGMSGEQERARHPIRPIRGALTIDRVLLDAPRLRIVQAIGWRVMPDGSVTFAINERPPSSTHVSNRQRCCPW